MRDLYVKLMSDKVHVHMAGPEASGPTFVVSGVSGITNPVAQAQTWTNEGLGLDLSLYIYKIEKQVLFIRFKWYLTHYMFMSSLNLFILA